MAKLGRWLVAVWLLAPALAIAETTSPPAEKPPENAVVKNARSGRSVPRAILCYVPDRVFDVFDLLRLRVRLGPGFAARVRVTEGADVGLGSYASVYVGVPGPRQMAKLPLPLGLESYTGAELGPGDAEIDGGESPAYASTEIGLSLQALVGGLDVGVDPFEIVDLLAGIVLLDFRSDDF